MTTTFPSGTFEFISGRVIVDAEDLENWRRTPGMFLSLPEARSSPCVSFPSLETREVTFMFLLSNGFPPWNLNYLDVDLRWQCCSLNTKVWAVVRCLEQRLQCKFLCFGGTEIASGLAPCLVNYQLQSIDMIYLFKCEISYRNCCWFQQITWNQWETVSFTVDTWWSSFCSAIEKSQAHITGMPSSSSSKYCL